MPARDDHIILRVLPVVQSRPVTHKTGIFCANRTPTGQPATHRPPHHRPPNRPPTTRHLGSLICVPFLHHRTCATATGHTSRQTNPLRRPPESTLHTITTSTTTRVHASQTLLLRILPLPRPVVALRVRLRLCDDWSIPWKSHQN